MFPRSAGEHSWPGACPKIADIVAPAERGPQYPVSGFSVIYYMLYSGQSPGGCSGRLQKFRSSCHYGLIFPKMQDIMTLNSSAASGRCRRQAGIHHCSDEGNGRDRACGAEGAGRNSQAEGPFSDETLESSAAPKKQSAAAGTPRRRRIFQVPYRGTEARRPLCLFSCPAQRPGNWILCPPLRGRLSGNCPLCSPPEAGNTTYSAKQFWKVLYAVVSKTETEFSDTLTGLSGNMDNMGPGSGALQIRAGDSVKAPHSGTVMREEKRGITDGTENTPL